MTGLANLAAMNAVRDTLPDRSHRERFEGYLLGLLAAHIATDTWDRVVAASNEYARTGKVSPANYIGDLAEPTF